MSLIAPSYEELLDALCKAMSQINCSTYPGSKTFWECDKIAARAGRRVELPKTPCDNEAA